ncbi:MAG: hypothetical protein K2K52_05915, partial [Paramuribaculum sp.]|nr:hypothetical protein [Paramuribaculum sp.]
IQLYNTVNHIKQLCRCYNFAWQDSSDNKKSINISSFRMKKILLFTAAFALSIVQQTHAQASGDPVSTIHISGAADDGTFIRQGNASVQGMGYSTWNNNAVNPASNGAGARHNEGALLYSDANGFSSYFCNSYLPNSKSPFDVYTIPTPYNGTLLAVQVSPNGTNTLAGEDKLQMLFEVQKPYRGVGLTLYDTNPDAPNSSYILVPEGTKLRFRTLEGVISSITIKIDGSCSLGNAKYGDAGNARDEWRSNDANISQNLNSIIIIPRPGKEKDFTIDLGSKCYALATVDGEWRPVQSISAPKDIPYILINGEKIDVSQEAVGAGYINASFGKYHVEKVGTGTNAHIEVAIEPTDRIFASVPLYEGVSTIWTKANNNSSDIDFSSNTPPPFDSRAFFYSTEDCFGWGAGTKNSFPHSAIMEYCGDTNGKLQFNNTTYGMNSASTLPCLMPAYQQNTPIEMLVTLTTPRYQTFQAWNSAGTSPAVVVSLTRTESANNRFADYEPDVFTPRLSEGTEYDAKTKTLYVTDKNIEAGNQILLTDHP